MAFPTKEARKAVMTANSPITVPRRPGRTPGLAQRRALLTAANHPEGWFPQTVNYRTLCALEESGGLAELEGADSPLLAGYRIRDLVKCRCVITDAGRALAAELPRERVIIVPCGGAKSSRPERAGEMYTGSYHRAARRAAEKLADRNTRILILSAKYGLLPLDEWISPYDLKAGDPGTITPEALRHQAFELLLGGAEVTVLGGAAYVALARSVWPDAAAPLEGTRGIGEQMQRLAAIAAGRPIAAEQQPGEARQTELPFDVELDADTATAYVPSLPDAWADPYTPKRGASPVRLVRGFTAHRGTAGARLEFSDTSRRGPERRELAAALGRHFGVHFETVVTYRTVYVDTGSEITDNGCFRGTSERQEIREVRLGRTRTDATVSAAPGDLARFVAVLPVLLDELDRLSAPWGKRCADWLTGEGEHWCTPSERRAAVTRFRREFRRDLVNVLTLPYTPRTAEEELDPGRPFPHQSRAAARESVREIGRKWLNQVTRPGTEAAYLLAVTTAEQLAAASADRRSAEAARATLQRIEAELAEQRAARAEQAAEPDTGRVVLTEIQLAQLDRLLDHPADDEPDRSEAQPAAAAAPVRIEAAPGAAELRERAELLRQIGAHGAAEVLLARAAELDAEQQGQDPAAVDLPAVRRPHQVPRRGHRRATWQQAHCPPRRPHNRPSAGSALRPPATAVGRSRRSPVRGTGGALQAPRSTTRQTA
ncbi:DUF6884 domain-containing protein [Kitasatospora sp. NPDC059646]|uniref:DUF6884 domain-containing protein n=1 Tax=Kitasatospora sp. NPDC059646 TaxID=3346893 RepID=UPI00367EA151